MSIIDPRTGKEIHGPTHTVALRAHEDAIRFLMSKLNETELNITILTALLEKIYAKSDLNIEKDIEEILAKFNALQNPPAEEKPEKKVKKKAKSKIEGKEQ